MLPPSAQLSEQTDNASNTRRDIAVLAAIATAFALAHIATNGRYGFHRDELQFLTDALHLDWGFVAYPPLTPFIQHLGLERLRALPRRLAPVLRHRAGCCHRHQRPHGARSWRRRPAQITAALAVGLSPLPIFEATEFQYTSFAFLWWVLDRLVHHPSAHTENPRWWLGIGAAIGLGLLTKYSIVFFIAGLLAGCALTPPAAISAARWFWLVSHRVPASPAQPLWLIRHNFVSYHFLQHIHARDVGEGRAEGFWKDQLLIDINVVAAPLAIAGLISFLRMRSRRPLAWMYVVPLLFFCLDKGASTMSPNPTRCSSPWAPS